MATNKATLSKATKSTDVGLDLDATERPKVTEAREALFKLDGVVYTIPQVCSPGVCLEYLRISGVAGEPTALIWAMQTLIDQNGYQVLVKDERLTAEQLGGITAVIISKVANGFKLPKA